MLFSFASPSPHRSHTDIDSALAEDQQLEEVDIREEIGATLASMMPWGVSIFVHMALVVLAFFLVWQTIVPPADPPVPPDVTLNRNVMSPSQSTMTKDETSSSSASSPFTPIVKPVNEVKPPTPGIKLPSPMIPVPGEGSGDWKQGTQRGNNDGPFGVGKGKDPGDGGGGSNEVVFLVDASGSMVDVLPFVINELKRVLNTEMGKENKATVLFFSGAGVFEMPGGKGMREVDAAFKQRFHEWVPLDNHHYQTGGRGSAFVRQALTRALSYKPQVIYLLSDNLTGGGLGATQHELNQDALIDLIHAQTDKASPARISTVQFLYEDPLVRAGLKGTLHRIADETGGQYKFLTQRDLNLR